MDKLILKCTVHKQEGSEKEAEYIFQGESLCADHYESYLASMLFLTKGKRHEG